MHLIKIIKEFAMSGDSALSEINVMFATPCYISAVCMNYTTSMFSLAASCNRVGLKSSLFMRSESLITRGRNKIVRDFIADESYTHLFFIDSDIEFTPEAVFRILLADRDIAAGIYPMKSVIWPDEGLPAQMTRQEYETAFTQYPFNPIGHGKEKISPYADEDGFVEVAEAPTGFMAIKRHVFLQMMKAYPHLQYTPDGPAGHPLAHLHWRFFDCFVDPDTNRYLSEDFAFCRLWRDMGGKVYADLQSRLGHLGQHMFRGDLQASLQAQGHW
jgi:hypothetical protein